jgi:hypothetical protein
MRARLTFQIRGAGQSPRLQGRLAEWLRVSAVGTKFIVPITGSVLPKLLAINPTPVNATLNFTDGLLSPAVSKNLNLAPTPANSVTKLGSDPQLHVDGGE